ncbi:aspartate aminotransferase [Halobiforma lacisalsi AJ5]|uniref:Aspartate aminotransferase n=1 Tax=Natronobacterium lacisalsi AJ5 TaxID=358396 RepID=M0L871_NATLA|nr:pyridoxal phosphate-dependent aminotransferase [Halobiforma lacisalsi]APW98139.1 aspartate aminotransferase [Halobiforma lacisalsi AJ5]EMA28120.1 aspartate transaminase [Halobiforma lacisalsi AJ5]
MEYETPLFFRVMEYASQAEGDVIDMVSGNPDWEPPEALRDALHEYADLEPDAFQYPPSPGLHELREEIAARRGVDAEQVVVTNGAGEANYLAMARALERDRGDEIVLADPVYPYYPGKTTMLGGTQTYVSTDETGQLDPAAVREAASEDTAAIVANSPNNPTGAVYPEETVRELVAIAEEYDAVLVSDEVYDHFDLAGNFSSALEVESDHRIVTNAFSKSLAITGFRVGYAIFPPELVENAKSRHMLVNVAGSRPSQYAVLQALRETDPDYYERNRDLLRERVDAFTDALDAAGASYTEPEGAFYVMARFEEYPGTLENVFELIDEAGVAGMPGTAFGDSRSDWIRFALVTPRVEEAADRLATYFE